jgi:TP901 family phage tail tape measure protein
MSSGFLGTLFARVTADMSGIEKAQAIMGTFSKTTITRLNNMSQKFRTFGYLSSAAVTLPMVMAGKASFKMATDFEFSMQKIVGLVGVAQKTVNDWEKSILKTAPALAKNPLELAESLYFIASAGQRGAEALNILEFSARAAAAGLGDTKDVASLLTSVMAAYAGTGMTTAKATDILVAAVREGKAEAADFATKLGSVLPIAASLGSSFDQVAGAMASMTLTGSSTAQAATYLKGVFNALYKESNKGAEALATMNTSYAQLREVLKNKGVIGLLQRVKDLSAEYGVTLASKVFPNVRALTAYLDIAGKNWDYNQEAMGRVTNSANSLNRAEVALADTFKIRLNKALAKFNTGVIILGKIVGDFLMPVIEKLAGFITRLIDRFDNLSSAQKKLRMWIALIVAALGPLSLLISLSGYLIAGLMGAYNGLFKIIDKLINIWPIFMVRFEMFHSRAQAQVVVTTLLTKGFKAAGVAMKAMSTTALVSWIGAAVAATAALVFIIVKLTKKKKELTELQKLEKGLFEERDENIAKEISSLRILTDVLAKGNLPASVRAELLKKYNEEYGDLLGYLLDETAATEDLEEAYDNLNKKLEQRIKLKYQEKLAEQAGEKLVKGKMDLSEAQTRAAEMRVTMPSGEHRTREWQKWRKEYMKTLAEVTKQTGIVTEAEISFNKYKDSWVDGLKEMAEAKDEDIVDDPAPLEFGYLTDLQSELDALLDKRKTVTKEHIRDNDARIAELKRLIAEFSLAEKAEKDYLNAQLEALEAKKIISETATRKAIMDIEYEKASLFAIEEKYLQSVIDLRKKQGENTVLLEAKLAQKVQEEVLRVMEETTDAMKVEDINAIELRALRAKREAELTIDNQEKLKRKLVDIEIEKQQALLDVRRVLGEEDVSVDQEALEQRKIANSQAEIDRINAQARALIKYRNTYQGVLDDIALDVEEGVITKVEGTLRERAAMIEFYEFIGKSAEDNIAFLEDLNRRELNSYINYLDDKLILATDNAERIAILDMKSHAEMLKRIERTQARMKSVGEVISRQFSQLGQDIAISIGETLGNMINGMEFSLDSLLGIIGNFLVSLGKALIATAMVTKAFKTMIATNPVAAIGIGIAAIAMGTYLKGMLDAGPNFGATSMAGGGLVYGSTYANVGEYPGARNNPELVSPVNTIIPIIQNAVGNSGRGGGKLSLELTGKTMQIVLDEEQEIQDRN